MGLKSEVDFPGLRKLATGNFVRPLPLIIAGAVLIMVSAYLLFGGSSRARTGEQAIDQGHRMVAELSIPVELLRSTLLDEQVQKLAAEVLENPANRQLLLSRLTGRLDGLHDVRIYGPDIMKAVLEGQVEDGENNLVLLDMMLSLSPQGVSNVQLVTDDGQSWVGAAASVGPPDERVGHMVILLHPDVIFDRFEATYPAGGYIALDHTAGSYPPVLLESYGEALPSGTAPAYLSVPGSMFRVVVPQSNEVVFLNSTQRLMVFLLGALLLAYGVIRRQMSLRSEVKFEPDPDAMSGTFKPTGDFRPAAPARQSLSELAFDRRQKHRRDGSITLAAIADATLPPEFLEDDEPGLPGDQVHLSDITYDLEQRRQHMSSSSAPVELTSEIFRAYDIRGVMGETLDAGIAYQVGQAVGSLVVEQSAGPVVVGRDGRHSGPEMVDGLVEGLTSAGCDVIDVGAVPTGALYFAAYELGNGSGVMVTGSHNPPDYNGLKIMISGIPLSGKDIFALYERIVSGNLRAGRGTTRGEDVLTAYRDRIAGDIQLSRPLKVVVDSGNGIGGICSGEILTAIGAEVLPLFDDVDGDFPNHHPDPSEPHNLEDLIGAVSAMGADLGLAFDGDADRLGVVTPSGSIIYADRLMMLFAEEILSRHPGETIIYDVKCTGHLETVIREAGGVPEMWKTGHSFIKTRMKEIGAPFAGEMSGHFFFGDRWYGFDCGIYTGARLLEILANSEISPEVLLEGLPNSVSTPELKVHLEEGENHEFVTRFQKEAVFEDARITTIDGVRADWDHGWGLVRASNTTPILVLRFDADTEEALKRIQTAFRTQLLAVKPGMTLPF